MPRAICSRPSCDHRIELQDPKNGTSVPTPTVCPKCGAPIIALCPECGFLLVGLVKERHPLCAVCKADIRQVFARIVFNLHRPQWKDSPQFVKREEKAVEISKHSEPFIKPRKFRSPAQIDAAIDKLRGRIKELEKLDVRRTVLNDPKAFSVAQNDVRDAISEVFGVDSPEYREHGYIDIWVGPLHMGMSVDERIQGRERGRIQVIGILNGLVGCLEERKADFTAASPSTVSDKPAAPGRNEKARHREGAFQIDTQPRETVPFQE